MPNGPDDTYDPRDIGPVEYDPNNPPRYSPNYPPPEVDDYDPKGYGSPWPTDADGERISRWEAGDVEVPTPDPED